MNAMTQLFLTLFDAGTVKAGFCKEKNRHRLISGWLFQLMEYFLVASLESDQKMGF